MPKELIIFSHPSISELEKFILESPEQGVTYSKQEGIISEIEGDPEVSGCIMMGYGIHVKYNEKNNGKTGAVFDITDIYVDELISKCYFKDIHEDLIGKKAIVYLRSGYDARREEDFCYVENAKIFFDD